MKNIIFIVFIFVGLIGCQRGPATYEVFKRNKDINMIRVMNSQNKQEYDETRNIYIFEDPKNCVYGYLTNKEDIHQRSIEWIILSGKEYCKEQQRYGCCM